MSGAAIRKRRRFSAPDFIIGAILFLWMLIILYPFYNSVMISLVTQKEYLMSDFLLFPKNITWDAYKFVFTSDSLFDGFKVTGIDVVV